MHYWFDLSCTPEICIFNLCICVYVSMGPHALRHMCGGPQDNLWRAALSFYHAGPRIQLELSGLVTNIFTHFIWPACQPGMYYSCLSFAYSSSCYNSDKSSPKWHRLRMSSTIKKRERATLSLLWWKPRCQRLIGSHGGLSWLNKVCGLPLMTGVPRLGQFASPNFSTVACWQSRCAPQTQNDAEFVVWGRWLLEGRPTQGTTR